MIKKLLVSIVLLGAFSASAQDSPPLLLLARGDLDATISIDVLNVETGEERHITDLERFFGPTGHDFGWSPEGQIWVVDDPGDHWVHSLTFYDPVSGAATPFGEEFEGRTCSSALDWSPDGRYMDYPTAAVDESEGLTIDDRQTGTHYTIPWIGQRSPEWSPDGDYFFIVDNYFEEGKSRLIRSIDGSRLLTAATGIWNRAFSPDNRFFAYERDATAWLYELATGDNISLDVPTKWLRWSPTGRYLLIDVFQADVPRTAVKSFYDTETGKLTSFDLNGISMFASWLEDERLLLYGDFGELVDVVSPQSLTAYDLGTGRSETLVEAEPLNWIGGATARDGWIAWVDYRSSEGDGGAWIGPYLRLTHNETELEFPIDNGDPAPLPDGSIYTEILSWSPDSRWLIVDAAQSSYSFDTRTSRFETLSPDGSPLQSQFWSPDSRYLAFQSGDQFSLWDTQVDQFVPLPGDMSALIGWQGGDQQASLVCLHGYGDADP